MNEVIFIPCKNQVTGLENDENFTKFTAAVEKLSQSTQTIADSLEEAIKIAAQEAVGANERKEIDEQEKVCNGGLLPFC